MGFTGYEFEDASMRLREGERLKRRILGLDRAGSDRWRQIALLYRLADAYGRRVYPVSHCHTLVGAASGCVTGECCQCRPDVFAYEREVLDRLPKRIDNGGYCPFFNRARKTCSIYAVRPLACRLYFNTAASRHCCQNPTDETLMLFDGVKRHVERILGAYLGGYVPDSGDAEERFPD